MERSFKEEVKALRLGDGDTFHGEGILAVTKALLQSGVSYVGGYQGAPISHLIDVLSDAKDLLDELGVHLETNASEAAAAAMLGALSGRTHRVLTAVAVWTGRRTLHALSVSRVRMAELPGPVIDAYVDSGEPYGKAGSYGIQGPIAGWIAHIEGSHSAIMGLPLHETAQLLRRAGVRLAL